jgi:branched-chain amino acid transport system permease protein
VTTVLALAGWGTWNDFFQLLFKGIALGAVYALVALGFVIIFKATGVINFAQGSLMLVGAYFAFNIAATWGWNFYLAVVLAAIGCGVVGLLVERLLLRRMVGRPLYAVLMITIGLVIIIDQLVTSVWGFEQHDLGDPWGNKTFKIGSVVLSVVDGITLLVAAGLVIVFFLFFTYTKYGLAMRATAFDQEAAMAQGISTRQIHGMAWAIAAMVATVAGVLVSSGTSSLGPAVEFTALAAFPAIILGGLDSTTGAIVGGVIIGAVQVLTAGYQPAHAAWLGQGFSSVSPYVVMIAILLVRPYGLFGTPEVRRV